MFRMLTLLFRASTFAAAARSILVKAIAVFKTRIIQFVIHALGIREPQDVALQDFQDARRIQYAHTCHNSLNVIMVDPYALGFYGELRAIEIMGQQLYQTSLPGSLFYF